MEILINSQRGKFSAEFNGKWGIRVECTVSTLHADSPLSAKLRGKFKPCEETHGGQYLGHSQNSVEFRGVDKCPRKNT